tara:strand:+ start:4030 stop:4494 length:465 start_codon:yes stop_codon:yes gene_type:complete
MKVFINLRTEPSVWRNKEISPGVFGKFASKLHQVNIGLKYSDNIRKWYNKNRGWYMSCYYIKNPLHMTLDDFKKLLGKIVIRLGFDDEGKKYFEGNCGELIKKMKKFMDSLIIVLNEETLSDNWGYQEDQYEKKYTIKKRFGELDNFMKENNIS